MTTRVIGTDRQLLVDDWWIAEARGVEAVLHTPERREVALAPEYPWVEGGLSYLTAIRDGAKIRGWYRADPLLQDSDFKSITCYAESDDGIYWTKPELDLVEFQGSTRNNNVCTEPGINFAPFKDNNPD